MPRPSILIKFTTKVMMLMVALAAIAGIAIASANVVVIYVPGTGGTSANPPAATDLSWLDSGTFNGLPVDGLTNSADYPAVLGPGVGQQSLDTGIASFIKKVQGYDPNTTTIVPVCGSQGCMVVYRALSQPGVAGYDIRPVLYSNPDTPGTGITARFPGMEVPTTGIMGGQPPQPTGFPILSVSHDWDPMAYFPKYAWTYLFTLPNAIVGFLDNHPDLATIDYAHSETTQDGNVTVVKLISPLTPISKLFVMVVGQAAGPQVATLVANLIKPADDIFAGVLKLGGQDEPGAVTMFPTPDVAFKQMVTLAKSFQQAGQDIVSLMSGHLVVNYSPTTGITPAQQVVQQAQQDDAAKNGVSPSSTASVSQVAATQPVTDPTPTAATPEAKVSDPVQSPSPTASTLKSTAAQTPAPQAGPEKPADDNKGDSETPASTPSTNPSKDSKQDAPKDHKQDPKDESDTPKVKAPKKGQHPKGSTDSDGDKPKSGSTVPKRDTKKGDKDSDSGSKPASDASSPKPQDRPSHKTGDSDGSKAPAHAGSGEGHHDHS